MRALWVVIILLCAQNMLVYYLLRDSLKEMQAHLNTELTWQAEINQMLLHEIHPDYEERPSK